MGHWIEQHPKTLEKLRKIVGETDWNLEYGDGGPVLLNNNDNYDQISIVRITRDIEDYYVLEHVEYSDEERNAIDGSVKRTERAGDIDTILKFTDHTVQNNS